MPPCGTPRAGARPAPAPWTKVSPMDLTKEPSRFLDPSTKEPSRPLETRSGEPLP